jgi:hypothetical protein
MAVMVITINFLMTIPPELAKEELVEVIEAG